MSDDLLIEKKRTQIRPWNVSNKRPEIPWDDRVYALSLTTGQVVVLEEEWIPAEDGSGVMVRKPGSEPDNNGIWVEGVQVKYPTMTYEQAVALFDDSEESSEPLTVVFARLYGRSKLTLDMIGYLGRLPKYHAVQEKKQAAKARIKATEASDEMIAAAGIEVPASLKRSEKAIERAQLAKIAVGGVSAELPKGVRMRGRRVSAPALGEEGAIGPLELVGGKGEKG